MHASQSFKGSDELRGSTDRQQINIQENEREPGHELQGRGQDSALNEYQMENYQLNRVDYNNGAQSPQNPPSIGSPTHRLMNNYNSRSMKQLNHAKDSYGIAGEKRKKIGLVTRQQAQASQNLTKQHEVEVNSLAQSAS